MSLPNVQGAGVSTGQPNRVDFNGAEHLDRLIPGRRLQIGEGAVDPSRPHTDTAVELKRREALIANQGALREQRSNDWASFSGQRRGGGTSTNLGAVAIDAPQPPDQPAPTTFTPEQLKNGAWATIAASFEEQQRGVQGRIGGADGVDLPPIAVNPTPTDPTGRAKNGRRAFVVG